MLFYEPLFLFLFGPAVYLLYFFFGADHADPKLCFKKPVHRADVRTHALGRQAFE